ncbi:putative ABC transporter C family member 2 [Monocercomonoides exilis]|uniref:putative ABC transporter C family member 2 n=1 Tax=Monocercomonoides exilis TaxID=2049356 RepID=UPI00355AAC31|nr:putative ABC transporter C family member 2 [Monocercomonoides exilis]|eukprot:MONOS_6391.1-p1 / transcript=MONOS_6391.1 / gene=MONOS_6391 / organism=Monocercomonoides_exilis_PA203 / gene_product=ABC transporter C family member 2 / transcript_product=ABC transporter C family member 2 / location=Mono_scaffold00200:88806-90302(+) / protein_length=366 / sequence_SO=supercontig / SO=protein_coding / is_pseudo=false
MSSDSLHLQRHYQIHILFHTPFDPVRYARVIQACCLEQNLDILPGGDEAEVGKRGYNLSGGQCVRIALARAVYSSAEVFLLDDILASVDAHVGQALVIKCISQLLKGKTVLLATHHTKYLPYFDTAIAMEEDGRIRKIGRAEEFKGIVKEMGVMVKEEKEGGGGEEEEKKEGERERKTLGDNFENNCEKKIKDANDIPSPSSSSSSSSSPFNLTHSNTSLSPPISRISHSPSHLSSSSSSSIIQTPISLSPSPSSSSSSSFSSSSSSSSPSPSPSPSELGHLKESFDMEADSVSLSSVLWYFKHASFFLLFLALLAINGKSAVLNTWTAKDAQMEQMNRILNGLGGEKRGEDEKKRKMNFEQNIE